MYFNLYGDVAFGNYPDKRTKEMVQIDFFTDFGYVDPSKKGSKKGFGEIVAKVGGILLRIGGITPEVGGITPQFSEIPVQTGEIHTLAGCRQNRPPGTLKKPSPFYYIIINIVNVFNIQPKFHNLAYLTIF